MDGRSSRSGRGLLTVPTKLRACPHLAVRTPHLWFWKGSPAGPFCCQLSAHHDRHPFLTDDGVDALAAVLCPSTGPVPSRALTGNRIDALAAVSSVHPLGPCLPVPSPHAVRTSVAWEMSARSTRTLMTSRPCPTASRSAVPTGPAGGSRSSQPAATGRYVPRVRRLAIPCNPSSPHSCTYALASGR